MTWSFTLGRLLGSEVRVHVTFFLLLAWIGISAYQEQGLPGAIENTAFVLALFACVLAHEFGHALMARRYGIATPDITLLPIGGLARLERMPTNPWHEIAVAFAGPAVNIAIWAILVVIGAGQWTLESLTDPAQAFTIWNFLGRLAAVNLILAIFNLIPAFPMDGGRVLRAALCLGMDRVKATRVASIAGQICAIGLAYLGLTSGNPVLVLVAGFVFIAANAENQDVAMRAVSRQFLARDAMITRFEALAPEDTLETASNAVIRTTQHEFPVLDPAGHPLGFVTRSDLFSALATDRPRMQQVSLIMQTDIPAVPLTAGLETVLDALHHGAPAVKVVTKSGTLAGYITAENIGELMVVKGR
ncbi:site-2 protease family protein [Phaeobacter sp. QD34_3]|uniref:site-2 protease family protein n=1 Tax=unclassified Phaeobacter TaxID=2621772 RepID=UPI00237F1002|nr:MULTISPECIES: site-2 protease family protein [unclassified Phaeobacter]MDE4131608.1 site-2 protease family protein [Phaeobacter sp. QD34_3]MDE4135303.1 site-2 protease family protein [Phaeobacter sp. QD34_24]